MNWHFLLTLQLNELNFKLQTQEQLVHELYGHVKAFQNKLRLWESQLRTGNTYHFPTLANHNLNMDSFAEKSLNEEFNTRFRDFRGQEANLKIFSSPFDVDVEQAPLSLQMELLELQENSDLKLKMKEISLSEFYKKYFLVDKFPKLAAFARKRMTLFGSRYKCEQLFSRMKFIKSKTRTRITDSHLENTLRVATSVVSPNIDKLVSNMRSQPSH